MDTKTIGMAVSASALGAALAYLGYSNYENKDSEGGSSSNVNGDPLEDLTNDLMPIKQNEFDTEEDLLVDEKNVKNEIKQVFEKKEWGQFWKSEYNKVDKNAKVKPGINSEGFN
jgi:hypothetical protein